MTSYLQVVRIHSFMKEVELYIRASFIVFLVVTVSWKRNKTCPPCLHSLVKTSAKFENSRGGDNPRLRLGLSLIPNSSKPFTFSTEGTEKMFCFFIENGDYKATEHHSFTAYFTIVQQALLNLWLLLVNIKIKRTKHCEPMRESS